MLLAGTEPVGVAVLRFRPALLTETLDCYPEELYVVPERRGQGLGRALMEAAIALARQRGAGRMDLGTGEDDVAARALNERLGFSNRGGRPERPVNYLYEREQCPPRDLGPSVGAVVQAGTRRASADTARRRRARRPCSRIDACDTGATLIPMPTRHRRHAITETPPVQAALNELRGELGDATRIEFGELVILGANQKVAQLRAAREDTTARRRQLAERVRRRDVPVDRAAADAVRRAGWARP